MPVMNKYLSYSRMNNDHLHSIDEYEDIYWQQQQMNEKNKTK